MMTWLVDVILALHKLGGRGRMKDICSVVKYARGISPTNDNPDETIRGTIYRHSSDSPVFDGSEPDLFEKGDEHGAWALRTYEDPNSMSLKYSEVDLISIAAIEMVKEGIEQFRDRDGAFLEALKERTVEIKKRFFGKTK